MASTRCRPPRACSSCQPRGWCRNKIGPCFNTARSACTARRVMRASETLVTDVPKPIVVDPARAADDAAWWRGLAQWSLSSNKELFEVVQVHQLAGSIIQSNCTVRFYNLKLQDGRNLRVALKEVDLSKNKYRDEEHRSRSLHSYQIERGFYEELAPLSMAVQETCRFAIPQTYAHVWNEAGTEGVTVMEDLASSHAVHMHAHASSAEESTGSHAADDTSNSRSPQQRLALSLEDTRMALEWLAAFHAFFWETPVGVPRPPVATEAEPEENTFISGTAHECHEQLSALVEAHLWPLGGYWSLEKRRSDLEKIESEWDRWLDAMQPVYSSLIQPSETNAAENNAAPAIDPLALKSLGRDLRVHADALHQQLLTWQREIGRTVIHGDFKTANLFFRNVHEGSREVSQVCACDFQWTGRGLPMQDVAYLLWTSVEPSVVRHHEDELLEYYMHELHAQLQARGVNVTEQHVHVHASDACNASGGEGSESKEGGGQGSAGGLSCDALRHQYEVGLLDYVRFLVGSMWGACTPESFVAKAGMLNQGMHKRDEAHHLHMLRRALALLAQEQQSGILAPTTRTTA